MRIRKRKKTTKSTSAKETEGNICYSTRLTAHPKPMKASVSVMIMTAIRSHRVKIERRQIQFQISLSYDQKTKSISHAFQNITSFKFVLIN